MEYNFVRNFYSGTLKYYGKVVVVRESFKFMLHFLSDKFFDKLETFFKKKVYRAGLF